MKAIEKQNYTLGFAFSKGYKEVVLLRKNRPRWQAGLLNGVGGKQQESETAWQGMAREFQEETGWATKEWMLFHTLHGDWGSVACFALMNDDLFHCPVAEREEPIIISEVGLLNPFRQDCVHNLCWLVPMAIDYHFNEFNQA